ncbi:NUDIX hydrolase [Stenotrophomonas rhizophila]|uniref:NUDIX hydrolase n=1 Tax=Stenotrophomonas rhizophila TaxID=216778 RepID=UPI001E294234|nr:NUDIX hydrolase [Stenotrophomonas rhizophila]MCC7633441.1 NUDIX hydrolase [Stenotrophomonas rhizophila]MCC7663074.1 NUDIX hydrolase [Stenotrophomonas rhizophila]
MPPNLQSIAVADAALRAQLADYAARQPEHAALADEFSTLLDDPENPFLRQRLAGHFTGSAWLVSTDGQRVLLTHHRKLDRWLQLGGHADGERDLAQVALKEAEEESGLGGLVLEDGGLFDIDKHWIPARHDVPGHWHYDARYVVRALGSEQFALSEESLALAWRQITDVANAMIDTPDGDDSLPRMAKRWLQR